MKRSIPSMLLAALFVAASLLGAQPSIHTEEILDAPGGHPIAILLPGANPRVVQEEGGYGKIVVEGWIRLAPPSSSAPAATAPAAEERVASSSVTGRIEIRLPSKEVRYGAGARVMLLGHSEDLESRRATLAAAYEKEMGALREKTAVYEAAKRKALNSSDNLGQATKNLDQAKADLARNQRNIEQVQKKYDTLEEGLLQEFKVRESTASPSGEYRLEGIDPGTYRLRVWFTEQGSAYRWYLPVQVLAQKDTTLDLTASKPGQDAFLTLP